MGDIARENIQRFSPEKIVDDWEAPFANLRR